MPYHGTHAGLFVRPSLSRLRVKIPDPLPPPIPRKGPPAAAEGHSRPLSPTDLSCSVWFHLCSVLSGCMLTATGGAHLA